MISKGTTKDEFSRRRFLAMTGGTLAGVAAFDLTNQVVAQEKLKRGGVLRYAMQSDSTGLDPHRNIIYFVSHPLAATTQGLLDINLKSLPSPGIAREWEISNDLKVYTFRLRKGVLFHNGREIDAAAVKWNFDRMREPDISHAFVRSALENLSEVVALDK